MGSGLTDVDGAILHVAMLQKSGWMLGGTQGFTAYPGGEPFWRIETVSQLFSIVFYKIGSLALRPDLVVTLFVWFGLYTTALMVWALCRKLGSTTVASVLVSILAQGLPWIHIQSGNYVSYVWAIGPLATVLAVLTFDWSRLSRSLCLVIGALLLCAISDAYWFFFSVLLVLIWSAVSAIRPPTRSVLPNIRSQSRTKRTLFFASLCGFVLFGKYIITSLGGVGHSRSIGVAPLSIVRSSSGGPLDFVKPEHWSPLVGDTQPRNVMYMGIGVALIFALALWWKRNDYNVRIVALLAFGLWTLTLTPTLDFAGVTIPSASNLARHIMPGVQYFNRAGIISQLLILAVASLGVDFVRQKIQPKAVSHTAVLALAVFLCCDGSIGTRPEFSNEFLRYSKVSEVLRNSVEPVVLALPVTKVGRSWHEQWILNVPFVNGLLTDGHLPEIDRQIASGPGALASYLTNLGVTHVYVASNFGKEQIGYDLRPPRFVQRATADTYAYEEGRLKMRLLEIRPQQSDRPCGKKPRCRSFYNFELVSGFEYDSGNEFHWLSSPSGKMIVRNEGPLGIFREATGSIEIPLTLSSLNEQIVIIKSGATQKRLVLSAEKPRTVLIRPSRTGEVLLQTQGRCAIPSELIVGSTDTRSLCLRVYLPKVTSP